MPFPVHRPRRLRIDSRLRNMVRQYSISADKLVYPIFIVEDLDEPSDIKAMPGQKHWPVAMIDKPVKEAMQKGVTAFMLFGVPAEKDKVGSSAIGSESIVALAIKELKTKCPEAYIITDVCLCAYTDHGHCGFMDEQKNLVTNDDTLTQLAKMALTHAQAGADMVAPSDMMDGRVQAIRNILDTNDFKELPIMSYSAKYASSFYGPFREAAGSAPGKGDRRGYQMDSAVGRDALIELEQDFQEGADILMVKPGMPYLDIVKLAKENFNLPVAVYQVSGEYSMIKAAAENGWVDEKSVVMESLLCMHRAGADIILTYFAPQVAAWLKGE
jgi:porphobilinogen synthase